MSEFVQTTHDPNCRIMFNIQGASVADILRLAYPSLYALHDPQRAVAGAPLDMFDYSSTVAVMLSLR